MQVQTEYGTVNEPTFFAPQPEQRDFFTSNKDKDFFGGNKQQVDILGTSNMQKETDLLGNNKKKKQNYY